MKNSRQILIEKAETAKRESKYIEFKSSFDVDSSQDWCEIIKDIVAIANSGGGIIIFGIMNDSTLADFDCSKISKLDSAIITDKIGKYTYTSFQDFEIVEIIRDKTKFAALIIAEIRIPMVFCKPGTYPIADGKQKTAFSQGTLYYRHGAKSEPCNSEDIKDIIERNLELIKKSWLGNIRKVVSAPIGATVQVLPPNIIVTTNQTATPIRLTDDKSAPAFHLAKPDDIYKYRRTVLAEEINNKLKGIKISTYDIQSVCYVYDIYKDVKFTYLPTYSSPQYSDAFIEWIVEQYSKDKDFFKKAREEYYNEYRKKE